MIPTLLLVGYVAGLFGRGRITIAVATVAWTLVIALSGTFDGVGDISAAGVFAAANTAVGAVVGFYSLRLSCYIRGRTAT